MDPNQNNVLNEPGEKRARSQSQTQSQGGSSEPRRGSGSSSGDAVSEPGQVEAPISSTPPLPASSPPAVPPPTSSFSNSSSSSSSFKKANRSKARGLLATLSAGFGSHRKLSECFIES